MYYIVVLSEEQQFQRASERCFVTQPTLSMQIKKAEEQLGYLVFDRDSNPLCLTPAGISLLPILREILIRTIKSNKIVLSNQETDNNSHNNNNNNESINSYSFVNNQLIGIILFI